MNIDLDIFDKNELIRAAQLIGIKNKNDQLNNLKLNELKSMILKKVNPNSNDLRGQYERTLNLFKVKFSSTDSDEAIKKKLFKFNCEKLERAISKMSAKKKKRLAERLEKSLDPTVLDDLRKLGKKGTMAGGGILALQGGAIILTGSNLGICMLLTTGLSTISGILGITFPFAAYTAAAVIGGKIIAVGAFLAQPEIAIPVLGLSLYLIYRNAKNKQYIKLAGVNYLIESKKALGI